jgi:hypothetical protein
MQISNPLKILKKSLVKKVINKKVTDKVFDFYYCGQKFSAKNFFYNFFELLSMSSNKFCVL